MSERATLLNHEWIALRLRELDKPALELARAIGTKRNATAYEILNGRRKIAVEEIPKIANFLEMSIEDVVLRLCGTPNTSNGPLASHIEESLRTITFTLIEKGFGDTNPKDFSDLVVTLLNIALTENETNTNKENYRSNVVSIETLSSLRKA